MLKINFSFNSNKDILSIDIGSKNTKLVVGKFQGKNIIVNKMYTIETPEESYSDGNIIDTNKLLFELLKVLGNEDKKIKKAICTSNSTAIITREIIVPSTDEKELDTIVKFEIEQYLPIDLEDYIIDYSLLEKLKEEDSEKLKLMVVAYPKHMAEEYLVLVKGLNLAPEALDINSNSLSKLLRTAAEVNGNKNNLEETVVFLDMGHEHLSLDVISKGINDFSRIITSGGKDIDLEISKKMNCSNEKAEQEKHNFISLSEDADYDGNSINTIVKYVVDQWIQEISRILQYYKNKKQGNKIDKIYIHGGSSKLNGIDKYMSSNLDIPVTRISAMSNINLNNEINDFDIISYLNTIGSLIRL